MKIGICTAVAAALLAASPASAQSLSTPYGLAMNLGKLRDSCSSDAAKRARENEMASFQARLDSDSARTKIEMDAQVYGVGHGRRATTEYLLEQYRLQAAGDADKAQKQADKSRMDTEAVAKCVERAVAEGKATYAMWKNMNKAKGKAAGDEARDVMTAWMVNTQSITLGAPNGTSESKAAWEKAKAHAELGSL